MISKAKTQDDSALLATAAQIRDQGKGRTISFSPKVFLPLTRLCRDYCKYCLFRQSTKQLRNFFMNPDEVLAVAREGERYGCREALLVLGENPEESYLEAKRWLKDHGYESTIEYLHSICKMLLRETSLYPHSNAGILTRSELKALKDVNVSLGLMLESSSPRLCEPGGPHEYAPSKKPEIRLQTLKQAGELKIPMTTGLLIGIGETSKERQDALHLIQNLHQQYGHIQEVIVQNFRAKKEIPMNSASELSLDKSLEIVAQARIILGKHMNIQVPPNLSGPPISSRYLQFLGAGINDWGGISPVTIDYVNPEAPWPHLTNLRKELLKTKFVLKARFPVYPEYINKKSGYLPVALKNRLVHDADPSGFIPQKSLRPIWEAHFAS